MNLDSIDAHTIYLAAAYAVTALLVMIEIAVLRVQAAKLRRREDEL